MRQHTFVFLSVIASIAFIPTERLRAEGEVKNYERCTLVGAGFDIRTYWENGKFKVGQLGNRPFQKEAGLKPGEERYSFESEFQDAGGRVHTTDDYAIIERDPKGRPTRIILATPDPKGKQKGVTPGIPFPVPLPEKIEATLDYKDDTCFKKETSMVRLGNDVLVYSRDLCLQLLRDTEKLSDSEAAVCDGAMKRLFTTYQKFQAEQGQRRRLFDPTGFGTNAGVNPFQMALTASTMCSYELGGVKAFSDLQREESYSIKVKPREGGAISK